MFIQAHLVELRFYVSLECLSVLCPAGNETFVTHSRHPTRHNNRSFQRRSSQPIT